MRLVLPAVRLGVSSRMLALVLPILFACSRSTTTNSSAAARMAEGENDQAGRQALGQLEDDWAKALEAHDTTFFARVVASNFHGTADSAKTFGRAEVMHDAADASTQIRNVQDEDRQIRIYGNGTVGIVTGMSRWTVEKGERPGPYSGRYTETWVKRDGSWQVVAGHYSDAPTPPSQP
jgi:ketosteroid isomerase-like protein